MKRLIGDFSAGPVFVSRSLYRTPSVVKILNQGNARGFPVLRSEAVDKKEFDPRAYSVFVCCYADCKHEMAPHRLNNYLRAYRRRAGLSQDDVAFLCGAKNGARVSRYECGKRRPTLENVLACEAIFRVPVRELFAGQFEGILRAVAKRAEIRAHELTVEKPGLATTRRLRALIDLGNGARKNP